MSRRPTPETDAAVIPLNGDYVVWHGFARRMECARDEAREEWGKASMDAAQLLSEKTKVIAERDELQDILRKLLEIIPEPECHDFGHTKEERHAFLERCSVMDRYDALITKAREAAK